MVTSFFIAYQLFNLSEIGRKLSITLYVLLGLEAAVKLSLMIYTVLVEDSECPSFSAFPLTPFSCVFIDFFLLITSSYNYRSRNRHDGLRR
jgi:hypothetical protein